MAEQQQQQQQQEQIVTPFAQILHTLHNVHKNYMQLTNVNSNRWRSYSDRVWTVASLGLVSSAAATDGVAPIFFLKKKLTSFSRSSPSAKWWLFFALRPRLFTVLSKFNSGVTHWRVSPGAVRPPLCPPSELRPLTVGTKLRLQCWRHSTKQNLMEISFNYVARHSMSEDLKFYRWTFFFINKLPSAAAQWTAIEFIPEVRSLWYGNE